MHENLDHFLNKFSTLTESYKFYNGEVEILYDKENHIYNLMQGDELVPKVSATTILDATINNSKVLVPWGCKMMAEKLLTSLPLKPELHEGKQVVPSMYLETLTKLINEAKSAHREKFEDAGAVGTMAHKGIEDYINWQLIKASKEPNLPKDERAIQCYKAALAWMRSHNVRWLSTETKVYSRIHEVPGTTDGRAYIDSCHDKLCCPYWFKNKLSMVDWKTSNFLYLKYLFQIAFYASAWMEEHPEDKIEDFWVIRLDKEGAGGIDNTGFDPWHIDTQEEIDLYYYGFLNCLRTYTSITHAEEAIKNKHDRLRTARKEQRQAAKAEQLKVKCANADKYKGVRRPSCNKGNPCKHCLSVYEAVQLLKMPKITLDKSQKLC